MTHKKAKREVDAGQRSRLPIWLLGGALVLAVIAIGFGMMSANAGDVNGSGRRGPQLAVNQERLDFGKVVFDKPVRAEFKLENTGDGVLTLDATTPIRVVEGC